MFLKSSLLWSTGLISATIAAKHDVQVGINGLSYTPNVTTADVGDTVVFHFYPGKHNVAQGDYNSPCNPLPGGFYSGFIAPTSGEDIDVFTITINDTNPIWIYCSEYMHCQLGMVAVINPPASGDNLQAYLTASAQTLNSTTPAAVAGGVISANGNATTSTASSSPISTTNPSNTASATPTQSKSEGIVIGGSNVVLSGISAMIAVAAFWVGLV